MSGMRCVAVAFGEEMVQSSKQVQIGCSGTDSKVQYIWTRWSSRIRPLPYSLGLWKSLAMSRLW